MKTSYIITAGILAAIAGNADASHFYANSISTNNIAIIQDSIIHNAIHTFDRAPAANLKHDTTNTPAPATKTDASALYGKKPMYGTMSIYGEYDENEFTGRSGGDSKTPLLKNLQFSLQHFSDKINFENYDRTDSQYTNAMIGITGDQTSFFDSVAGWAIYGGYINGKQSNNHFHIKENGGYTGIYSRFNTKHFNLSATVNGGALINNAETIYGTDNYTNLWLGAAAKASINIILDDTFALQPGVHIGYTWIKSDNYVSASGDYISNSNLSALEISPAVYAIKHIGSGWFGSAHVRYVNTYADGGDLAVNSVNLETLDSNNFTEYGLSLEKTVGRFNLSSTLVRRDGGRDGWGGNLNIKYIF